LTDADEIMGQARWRSLALPPPSAEENALRTRAPSVNVTRLETRGLRPWPVPYRGELEPDAPIEFQPDEVAWFEFGFLRSMEIDSVRAEVVKVSDESMVPVLWPTSTVLVDRRRTAKRDGAIYEIMAEEGLVLRRLFRAGRRWRVATETRSMSPPRPLRSTDRIVGEAVWTGAFLSGDAA